MASSGKTEEPSPSTDAAVGAERLSFPQHLASGGFLGRPTPKVPKEGQESVWAPPFTRPPTLRKVARHAVVKVGDVVIADAKEAYQVCETSHPPTWYLPQAAVVTKYLHPIGGDTTLCEFKGRATYFNIVTPANTVPQAAWAYAKPAEGSEAIAGHYAFYARNGVVVTVDGKPVTPQAGDFYGGWITEDIVGPFKGGPGTRFW